MSPPLPIAAPDSLGPPRARDWPVYRLYGANLASDYPFANRLAPAPAGAAPDLLFTCIEGAPPESEPAEPPVFLSPYVTLDGESILRVYRQGDGALLVYPGVAQFTVRAQSIHCHLLDPDYRPLIEIHLLGTVLSCWLELRGVLALHASGVVLNGRAIGFLSDNHGGKSSLAAAFLQAGHPLLTDDILAIEARGEHPIAYPGYPQMRFWPEQAEYFLGSSHDLEDVHPLLSKKRVPVGPDGLGVFSESPAPLACIYLPRRLSENGGGGIAIEPLSRSEALIELIRHSFLPEMMGALGLHERRLRSLARLARRVPVRSLHYPDGLEQLPAARAAIARDLAGIIPPDSK